MNMYRIVFQFLFLGIYLSAAGQTPNKLELLQKKYPGETSVITNDLENIQIDVAGAGYKITEEVIKETLFLKNPTDYMITDKVYVTHFNKLLDLEAKTMVPEGEKFKTQKVEKFTDQKDQPDFVFYDEVVAKTFVFPAVQPGAITSLRYVQELKDPHMLGTFYFKWHVPCELSKISIKADKKARLKYKLFNVLPNEVNFSVEEKGKYNVYTWTAKDIKASEYEKDAPSFKYYYPHIAFFIENSDPANNSDSQFAGLDDLYKYYWGLTKNVNSNEDPAIKEQVEKITSGAQTEEEKVKRIYYWVQDNIQYVAFEAGMQGLIPEPASQVFSKRYGDCKGMASLLNTMLKSAGIKSNITWVGTRDLPYKYTEIPSSISDNHMIVTYYQNGQPVFLDATNNYLPFGIPSSMIQGKQALVGFDDNNYKVEEIPVLKGEDNQVTDSTSFEISESSITGSGMMSLTAYEKNNSTYSLVGKNQQQTKEFLLGILNKGNNKFFLDTFTIQNLTEREKPMRISYQFRLNDYVKKIDNEIYINLNLNRGYNNLIYDPKKRSVPVNTENQNTYRTISVFKIPDGYEVEYLPKNISSASNKFSCSIAYKVENGRVIQTKELKKEFLILNPDEFDQWNKVNGTLSQAYRDVLILKKS